MPKKNQIDRIIARGGLRLPPLVSSVARSEALAAIQDALASINRQQSNTGWIGTSGARRLRIWSLACLASGIAVLVASHDLAGTVALLVGAAAFEGLGVYSIRLGQRLETAEEILYRQMCSLEGAGETPWPNSDAAKPD